MSEYKETKQINGKQNNLCFFWLCCYWFLFRLFFIFIRLFRFMLLNDISHSNRKVNIYWKLLSRWAITQSFSFTATTRFWYLELLPTHRTLRISYTAEQHINSYIRYVYFLCFCYELRALCSPWKLAKLEKNIHDWIEEEWIMCRKVYVEHFAASKQFVCSIET